MNQITPDEFVSVMELEMERIAELAIREQSTVIPFSKRSHDEDSIKHEPNSASRVGVFSRVDLEIQEILLKFIYEKWPFLSVLAEENSKTVSKFQVDSPYCLLIDPVDGTKNYLNGGSDFCHTISLMKDGIMLVSMVYSHARKRLYGAIANQGALVFSKEYSRKRIVVEPPKGNIFLYHVSRITSELLQDLRMLNYTITPSSQNASDILSMLDGNIIGFISLTPIVYDVWSPAMIVQEAGGWVSDWFGNPLRFETKVRIPQAFVAASEEIANKILPILGEHVSTHRKSKTCKTKFRYFQPRI
jgi:fructose-1,6-bisphosphatase/inositol monophosphatase family enzyme